MEHPRKKVKQSKKKKQARKNSKAKVKNVGVDRLTSLPIELLTEVSF